MGLPRGHKFLHRLLMQNIVQLFHKKETWTLEQEIFRLLVTRLSPFPSMFSNSIFLRVIKAWDFFIKACATKFFTCPFWKQLPSKIKVTQIVFVAVGNNVENERNTDYQHCFLFPTVFSKALFEIKT